VSQKSKEQLLLVTTKKEESTPKYISVASNMLSNLSYYPHPGIDVKNVVITLGGSIPSAGTVSTPVLSLFTKTPVFGSPFILEDGKSFLSMAEALMWVSVNPFSPLNTGHVINPY
jgi:hypothetical protein